jgi:hypothetical protein
MMVSIAAVMYSAVTYYKYERWEEYLAIIDNMKISSNHVVEMSLANYTLTMNNTILRDNLNQWRNDVKEVYPGYAIVIGYQLANGSQSAYGENITYNLGLARSWFTSTALSAANVTITLNITSAGLTGYQFVAEAFLRVEILNATWDNIDSVVILLAVEKEGPTPVTDLEKDDFSISFSPDPGPFNVTLRRYYDATYGFIIYEISCNNVSQQPSSVEVSVVDTRNMKVIANSTVTQS